jgi:hypothetical protein
VSFLNAVLAIWGECAGRKLVPQGRLSETPEQNEQKPADRPPPPSWDELSRWRWGGADERPGIDNPGRRPSTGALAAALDPGLDPDAAAERADGGHPVADGPTLLGDAPRREDRLREAPRHATARGPAAPRRKVASLEDHEGLLTVVRPRPQRKRDLTREEWKAIADLVRDAEERLNSVAQHLGGRLAVRAGDIDLVLRARNRVQRVKSHLENLMFRQHPDWDDSAMGLFYGPRRQETETH